jgi:CubicO group peptidase (beta-lactamase class C family)
MGDGEGVLQRATLDEMQTSQLEVGSTFEHVGITWSISERTGTRLVGHSGGTNGQQSLFFFAPEHDFALAVLTNHQRGSDVAAAARAPALEAIGAREPKREAVDLDVEEYLGRYESALIEAELRRDDGTLVLAVAPKGGFPKKDSPPPPAPPPEPVAFYAPNRLFATGESPGEADFLRDEDGSIAWFRVGGRVMARID